MFPAKIESLLYRLSTKSYPLYCWNEKRIGFRKPKRGGQHPEFRNALGQKIDVQAVLEELYENGAASIENFYSEEYIHEVNEGCEQILKNYHANQISPAKLFDHRFGYDNAMLSEGVIRFYKAEEKVSLINRYISDPFIQYIGEQYYGRRMRRETTIFQHNIVTQKGTRAWHIDSWVNQFKPFLYLTDVEEGNGPFTYVLGSHRNNDFLLRKTFACLHGEDTGISNEVVTKLGLKIKEFHAKRGTLLLADTKGVHRGGYLKQGTRSALVNYFYA